MSETVVERRSMRAAPDEVLDTIIDVEAYPQWQPEVRTVEVLERDARGRAARARFVVDAKLFEADYTLAYDYGDETVRWELVESEQLRRLDGGYTVRGEADGSSVVTYELVAEPTMSLPGFLRRQAAQRIVRSALDTLRARVESGGG